MKRIVNSIFSDLPLCLVPFISFFSFLSSCFPEGIAAKLLKGSVAVTDSTQYHMAKRHITGQWLPPLTPARCCHPLHSWHKGLPALCTPGRQNGTPAAVPSACFPFWLFFKNPLFQILWKWKSRRNFNFYKSPKYIGSILWTDRSLFIFSDWLIQSIFNNEQNKRH